MGNRHTASELVRLAREVMADATPVPTDVAHLTAISRKSLSVPARYAVQNLKQYLTGKSILDYGCGRGGDVFQLQELGYDVLGYDPHWKPQMPKGTFDFVLMSYVLNVIASPKDRAKALQGAFAKTRKHLLVTIRIDKPAETRGWTKHKDGYLTGSGTFQAFVPDADMIDFIKASLPSAKVKMLKRGMFLISK